MPTRYYDWGTAPGNDSADVSYDNSTSGLAATDVQHAIDEVDGNADVLTNVVTNLQTTVNAINADVIALDADVTALDAANDKKTTASHTYYVRTTGSDSNDGLSEANACATVQHILNIIPKNVLHLTYVDIGAGSFDAFHVNGFRPRDGGRLIIYGTMGLATGLTTGTASGTATGGTTTTLIDATQNWTPDELVGKYVRTTGDAIYSLIWKNTADTLYYTLVSPLPVGLAYEIQDQKTIITGTAPWSNLHAAVMVSGNVLPIWLVGQSYGLDISNMRVSNPGNTGMMFENTSIGMVRRIAAYSSSIGFTFQEIYGAFKAIDLFATTNTTVGFLFTRSVGYGLFYGSVAYANTGATYGGFAFGDYCYIQGLSAHKLVSRNNTGPGFVFYRPYVTYRDMHATLDGNSIGLNVLPDAGYASIYSLAVTGTNTTYGMRIDAPATVRVTSATQVTGATGDLTIDGGSTSLTWAGDFAVNLSVETNPTLFCRVERRD